MENDKRFAKKLDKLNIRVLFGLLIVILFVSFFIISIISVTNINSINSKLEIGLSITVAFLCVVFLAIIFIYIEKSLDCVSDYANKLAEGNLNLNDINIEGQNKFASILKSTNILKSNILFFIESTRFNVIILSDAIESLIKSTNIYYEGNIQIASKMEAIAYKSQNQLNLVVDSTEKTDEISKSINAISNHINEVKNTALETNKSTLLGKEIVNKYSENIEIISKSIYNTSAFILELKNSAGEISKVVDFIVGLNEQLKMLSINASIEASRAGEAGRGFSVVAEEIIKLSLNTKEGIDKINIIVKKIIENSENVSESINCSEENLSKGNQVFDDIKESFNNIGLKNENILIEFNKMIEEISSINSNTEDNLLLSQKINGICTEVTQSTEDSVAVTEEELAEFQHINEEMSRLKELSLKIRNLVKKIDLDILPANENPKKELKLAFVIPIFGDVFNIARYGAIYAIKSIENKNTTVDILALKNFSEDECDEILKEALKKNYDGYILPGFFPRIINAMANKKLPVIVYDVDIDSKENRIAYVGQNAFESGKMAAKVMNKKLLGKGNVLIINSNAHLKMMEERKDGFIQGVKDYKNIKIVDILEIPFGHDGAYKVMKEYLQNHSNIHGIFNVIGETETLVQLYKELNLENKVDTIVYDTTKENLDFINNGKITCAIGQDPFKEGYDPIIYLYNYLVKGIIPKEGVTCTKIQIVDKNNVKHFLE